MTKVLMFPVDRCRNEIDRIARNLNSLNGETANRYWKLEMRVLAERWKACGFSDDEIAHKVILLTTAVQLALCGMWGESSIAAED